MPIFTSVAALVALVTLNEIHPITVGAVVWFSKVIGSFYWLYTCSWDDVVAQFLAFFVAKFCYLVSILLVGMKFPAEWLFSNASFFMIGCSSLIIFLLFFSAGLCVWLLEVDTYLLFFSFYCRRFWSSIYPCTNNFAAVLIKWFCYSL